MDHRFFPHNSQYNFLHRHSIVKILKNRWGNGFISQKPSTICSPLEGLSFEDALTVIPIWQGIEMTSQQLIVSELSAHFGDGIAASTNAIRFVQQTGEYLVEFSKEGKALLQVGKATLMKSQETGKMIPSLIGMDGKIIENAREIGKFKSVAGKLASLSSAVIGAAHIISGADMVRKLEKVGLDVNFLVEGRKNDQLGKLEISFYAAKQALSGPLTIESKTEIRRIMRDLGELRIVWRRDLETKLQNITNPKNAGFFTRLFTRQRTSDKRVANSISQFRQDLALIEVSFILQIALAQTAGDTATFFRETLPSEIGLLRKTSELLTEKASYIVSTDVHVAPMLEAMIGIIERMSSLAPLETESGNPQGILQV